jgi:hypothetical protein
MWHPAVRMGYQVSDYKVGMINTHSIKDYGLMPKVLS